MPTPGTGEPAREASGPQRAWVASRQASETGPLAKRLTRCSVQPVTFLHSGGQATTRQPTPMNDATLAHQDCG